ncbi:MAG: extracellular solute-binding protein [Spirochaetales bacterium]|nr:extracellular solute-binding protein [Spirochaetales bacterium]
MKTKIGYYIFTGYLLLWSTFFLFSIEVKEQEEWDLFSEYQYWIYNNASEDLNSADYKIGDYLPMKIKEGTIRFLTSRIALIDIENYPSVADYSVDSSCPNDFTKIEFVFREEAFACDKFSMPKLTLYVHPSASDDTILYSYFMGRTFREGRLARRIIETHLPNEGDMQNKPVEIRWYVGLGAGCNIADVEPQQKIVDIFNNSSKDIKLKLEIVYDFHSFDELNRQIVMGNAPDIVGPMYIRNRDVFKNVWLDLEPLIQKHNYDLDDFDPALIDLNRVDGEGLIGLPFGVFPSVIFFNKDLFDKAKLKYPPQHYGEPYIMPNGVKKKWDFNTLKDIAMRLTLDSRKRNLLNARFDAHDIMQFGFHFQYMDCLGIGALFGAGSLIDKKWNAQIPSRWLEGWKWHRNGIWKYFFMPNIERENENPFIQNKIAMILGRFWYTRKEYISNLQANWDIACIPSYKGKLTGSIQTCTFGIMKACKNPEAAFKVLEYLFGPAAEDLIQIYGYMPAKKSLLNSYIKQYSEQTYLKGHNINWQVAIDSIHYVDNPNHENWLPRFAKTYARLNEFYKSVTHDPKYKIDNGVKKLKHDLQLIFQSKKK